MDEDIQAAAARLVRRLKEGGHTITVAESCTGGLLASAFTDIAGASNWFNQSWVTYSNDAKMAELNVEQETLEKHGAVSANVAIEMAKGALEQAMLISQFQSLESPALAMIVQQRKLVQFMLESPLILGQMLNQPKLVEIVQRTKLALFISPC